MKKIFNSIKHWPDESVKQEIKLELLNLEPGSLPLHLATTQGGIVNESNLGLTILSCSDMTDDIVIKAGVFFTEVIGGCNCDDDPIEIPAYCLISISINKTTAHAVFNLIEE